ncbi:DUF1449 domain-containing protein [Vibrio brasiliensis]|jgi:hypothetical protein|uniref:DUF1449 domain-containing protein n=2 Tax=Vibrio brasiliensis TaxID=170652 RepID=UPI001EFD8EE8|nr:DUF1449 domain-containing protein [Vibrio brasiliensis]MCG9752981.1 DUF1449 domain-containing protein [Vibrio brasiliensis]MCG9784823.1 DUF1449 domain-containing protein [Vibrio brasiliensis]
MNLSEFFSVLTAFPTNVFFVPLVFISLVMLVDLVFNVVESTVLSEFDLFDIDNIPGAGLLLPPLLSKVPLMVALSTSFFIATVMSFYVSHYSQNWLSGLLLEGLNVLSLPIIAYFSLVIAAWLLKPLSPLFDKKKAFAHVEFVGLKARVHSSLVTTDMGEIMVMQNGNEYLLDAICNQGVEFKYGDEVVIVAKTTEPRRYLIAEK